MERKAVRGHLIVAIRKISRYNYLVRVGYTKRTIEQWLKHYRKDGFRKCHLHLVTTFNGTLFQAREVLLHQIAARLERDNVKVMAHGESDYAYIVSSKKAIIALLKELENQITVKETPVEVQSTYRCLIM